MRKNIKVREKVGDQAMDIQSILDSCGCAALLNKALRGTFQRENNRTIDFVCVKLESASKVWQIKQWITCF